MIGTWCRSQLPALKGGERGALKAPGLDQEERQLLSYLVLHPKPTTRGLVHLWKHPWCRDKSRATLIHWTHHGPDLGEAITFPHIVFSVLFHRAHAQMALCPGTPKWSPKTVQIWTLETLGIHNFSLRPSIGTRSKTNLQLSLRAFQQCVALHLHTPGSGRFPNFCGQESNYQFDSRPFFRP